MRRTILSPAMLPDAALGELKDWLGVTTASGDAPLRQVLRTALDMCEGFTGLMPLEAACEELLPARRDWQRLATRPIQAITAIESVAPGGTRAALAVADYAVDLDADGHARVRLANPAAASRIAVRFTAGLAAEWDALPDAIRHGLVRLAASQYRDRDESGAGHVPPAAVAALWRPWRGLRLA